MIKIKNTTEAIQKLAQQELSHNLIKDILLNTFIFDTQFNTYSANEIVLLNNNEKYDTASLIPEIQEEVDGYKKTIYILSNAGEALITYEKIVDDTSDNDTNKKAAERL